MAILRKLCYVLVKTLGLENEEENNPMETSETRKKELSKWRKQIGNTYFSDTQTNIEERLNIQNSNFAKEISLGYQRCINNIEGNNYKRAC